MLKSLVSIQKNLNLCYYLVNLFRFHFFKIFSFIFFIMANVNNTLNIPILWI